MSYPYTSDLMFGSEMSAVGGNVPLVVSSVPSSPKYGPVEPEEGIVFCSSIRKVYKHTSVGDVHTFEPLECYYVFDLSTLSNVEEESLENLKTVLRKLEITLSQKLDSSSGSNTWVGFSDESQHHSTSNLSSITQDMGDGWNLDMSSGVLTLTFPNSNTTKTISTSFYCVEGTEPVDMSSIYYFDHYVGTGTKPDGGDPLPEYSSREYSFTDK